MSCCPGILNDTTSCVSSEEWGVCAVPFFRALVGDFNDPPTWSNSRATDILRVAASQVIADLSGCSALSAPTINICTGEFSSNPYLYSGFFNLWQLKAACIVDQGTVRTKAIMDGIKAVAGPASLSIMGGNTIYSSLFKSGPCQGYQDMLENLCFRSPLATAASCSQILGVFVSEYLGDKCNGTCSYYR